MILNPMNVKSKEKADQSMISYHIEVLTAGTPTICENSEETNEKQKNVNDITNHVTLLTTHLQC